MSCRMIFRRALLVSSLSSLMVGLAALASSDASAQNVHTFQCTDDAFGVKMDIRGLGNQNICVVGTVTADLNCACAGGGGNCPSDTKKQSEPVTTSDGAALEPKNGRVVETFDLPFSAGDGQCASLDCPGGQREKLISFEIANDGAQFTLCATDADPGQPCNCIGEDPIAEVSCGPGEEVVFAGKRSSCLRLFD